MQFKSTVRIIISTGSQLHMEGVVHEVTNFLFFYDLFGSSNDKLVRGNV